VADGGATYTVNIELATRQFSQDLRNLRTKIKNELGKAVKVTATPDQKSEAKEKARKLRQQRQEDQAAKKRFYNADRIKAFQVRQGEAVSANLKLEKYGLNVLQRKIQLGKVQEAAELGKIQWAEAKLKKLNKEIDAEFKILDLINKQSEAEKKLAAETKKKAEAEKKAQDRAKEVVATRKREDKAKKAEATALRQRKGPHGSVMHGPVDIYGNPIYQGGTSRGPSIPKTGAALPIDLGRKGTGTFAAQQTKLLRRREVLETLLKTFDGVKTDEVRKFKTGIQSLLSQYEKVSGMRGKMKPQGKGYSATGGWGEWKGDKLLTKDRIGNAGEIARELEQLDNLTKKEESRAKRIKASNEFELKAAKQKSAFLNKEHSARKLIERLKKKGLKTTELELKLEKAITAQDKDQLDAAAREIDMTNARTTRVGKEGKKGRSGGGTVAAKGGGGNFGRIASAAGISGGFPLLFGQSPLVAGISAGGGALGEAVTPGGGFAGGIVASAAATYISEVIAFRKEISNLNKEMSLMGVGAGYSAKEIVKLGNKLNVTKQEALKIAEQFKRFGKDGGLFAQYFGGDIGQFTASVQAVDMQSAMAAIKATAKDISIEDELRYSILLRTKGVEATINQIVNERIEKQKKARNEDAKKTIEQAKVMNKGIGGKRWYDRGGYSLLGTEEGNIEKVSKRVEKELDNALGDDSKLKENFDKRREQMRQAMYEAENLKYSVLTAIDGIDTELRKLSNTQYQVVQLSKSIGSSFSESFKGIVSGSMSAQQALANLFQRTADHFLDMAAQMAATQLQKGILSLFNFGSNPLDSIYNADHSSNPFVTQYVGKKAAGGPVSGGSPYIVGEKGPELFVPGSSGNIVPNHEMGGANVVVNVDASGSSVEGDAGQAEQLGSMLAAAVQSEIANQQRPGGLLARR